MSADRLRGTRILNWEWHPEVGWVNEDDDPALTEEPLLDRIEELTEALKKYGRHSPLCANVGGYEYDCNCGFAEVTP